MEPVQQPKRGMVPRGLSAALSAFLLFIPHDRHLAELCGPAHCMGERLAGLKLEAGQEKIGENLV